MFCRVDFALVVTVRSLFEDDVFLFALDNRSIRAGGNPPDLSRDDLTGLGSLRAADLEPIGVPVLPCPIVSLPSNAFNAASVPPPEPKIIKMCSVDFCLS